MYKIFLALKFFFSRKINLISVVGIAAGVWLLTVVPSVMDGFIHEQRKLFRGSLSDIVVRPLPYKVEDSSQSYRSYEEYKEALLSVPHVKACAPRMQWISFLGEESIGNPILSSNQFKDLNVIWVIGLDPKEEIKVGNFEQYLTAEPLPGGSPVAEPTDPFTLPLKEITRLYGKEEAAYAKNGFPVIFSEPIFRRLQLKKGERVVLPTFRWLEKHELEQNKDRQTDIKQISRKFYVAGSLRTGEHEIDFAKVYIPIETAKEWLDTERDCTEIVVKLDDYKHANEVRNAIEAKLQSAGLPAIAETWEEQRQAFLKAVDNENRILLFLLSAVILVAGINIFVILSMMVTHKTRDIGIISALGGTRRGTMAVFLGVGFFVALFGELIGGIAGYYSVKYLTPFEMFLREHLGINLFPGDIYGFDRLPAVFSWTWFVSLLGLTLLTCLLASLPPALRAARLRPVEALRYE